MGPILIKNVCRANRYDPASLPRDTKALLYDYNYFIINNLWIHA